MKRNGRAGLRTALAGAALVCLLLAGCSGDEVEVPGLGTVQKRARLDSGVEYGITDQDYAVVLQVPETVEELDLTGLEQDRTGVYILASALDEAGELRAVILGEQAAFDGELLDRLRNLTEFSYPEDCLTSDWVLTVEQAAAVNKLRGENDLPEVTPDLELTRISRLRTGELVEKWDTAERPNGTPVKTLLDEEGYDYTFQTGYSAKAADVEAMYGETCLPAIAEAYGTPINISYDKVGYAIRAVYQEEQPYYILYTFAASSSKEGKTVDGYSYQVAENDGGPYLRITDYDGEVQNGIVPETIGTCPVKEVDEGLFQNRPDLLGANFPDTVTQIPEEIFNGSEQVRAIQVGPETQVPDGMKEQYLVFTGGQDLGDGTLRWTWVYEDAVYGQTSKGTFVLLDLSPGIAEYSIPQQYGDYPVTYIHDDALARTTDLTTLTLPEACGFSKAFYDEVVGGGLSVRVSSDSMGKCLYYGYQVAEDINELRGEAGLPEIQVSVQLTRLARIRAQELEESFGTTRPDGTSGLSVLNENSFSYDIGYEKAGAADTVGGVEDSFYQKWTQDCAYYRTYNDNTYLLEQIGVGVYLGQRDGKDRAFVDWLSVKLKDEA